MILYYILDDEGEPVPCHDIERWAKFFGDAKARTLAQTRLSDGVTVVSTVFLGIDHSFGDGPPLLFETMAFHAWNARREKGEDWADMEPDDEMWRYPTRAVALEGHRRAVGFFEERLLAVAERLGEIVAEKKKVPTD